MYVAALHESTLMGERTHQAVRIDSARIYDWTSFHSLFADVMGFPRYYGRNMDAWIDCLTSLDDPDAGMSTVTVGVGELLYLEITDSFDFQSRTPEIFRAFIESAASVNRRRVEAGERPVLSLVLL